VFLAGALLLSALFVGPADAGEQSSGPEKAVLQQLSKAYAKVDSFEADFAQTSSGMSYAKPMVQMGRLYVQRPHKMHWDFREPTRQQYISDGSTFWWVDHSAKTTTVYRKMDSVLGHFFDLLTGLSGATDNFRVSLESGEFTRPGCNTLKLVPRKDGAGLGTLYVHVSEESSLVVAVTNVTLFGDTTLLELGEMTLNEKHESAHFQWTKTKGFKLIEGG
jgi:outer membrane lipoprotein carrier protein